MRYIVLTITLFALLFAAFHPGMLNGATYTAPDFDAVWDFGYNVVFGPFEVLSSIGDGVTVFIDRLVDWFKMLFGG